MLKPYLPKALAELANFGEAKCGAVTDPGDPPGTKRTSLSNDDTGFEGGPERDHLNGKAQEFIACAENKGTIDMLDSEYAKHALHSDLSDTPASAPLTDSFTIFVAPGIDTVNGPVQISDLGADESVHIIVAEAFDHDIVTARLAKNGNDTEVIYRGEVVAVLKGLTRIGANQVIFAPMALVTIEEQDSQDTLDNDTAEETVASAEPEHFVWNGFDRSSLQLKPITVADYVPGLDRLEVNLGFGPLTPKVLIEDAGDGDTFVRVNGKALFRLQDVAAHEISAADVQVNRL